MLKWKDAWLSDIADAIAKYGPGILNTGTGMRNRELDRESPTVQDEAKIEGGWLSAVWDAVAKYGPGILNTGTGMRNRELERESPTAQDNAGMEAFVDKLWNTIISPVVSLMVREC